MHRCKKTVLRLIELLTGERADRLEVAYSKAPPEERAQARDQYVEEKAKSRLTALATAAALLMATYIIEKLLPEA
jgi:hypothetical protein